MEEIIYGRWSGNPNGVKQDKTKCIVKVFSKFHVSHQCERKRGYGKNGYYCKQHSLKEKINEY